VSTAEIILTLVTLQRLCELVIAATNTRRLMARGATEVAAGHYPLLVMTHVAWLIALWLWGRDQAVDPVALVLFIVLQGLRVWVIATLGRRWTTRIVVEPHQRLVASGPYRYLSHPNYAIVAGEIALLPLALQLPLVALVFTVLNTVVLGIRIRAEEQALAALRAWPAQARP
jgi:methyltransferase